MLIEFDICDEFSELTFKGWVNPQRIAWITDYKPKPDDAFKPESARTFICFSEKDGDYLIVKESVKSVLTRLSPESTIELDISSGLSSEELARRIRKM